MSCKSIVLFVIFVMIGLWLLTLAYVQRTDHKGELQLDRGLSYYAPAAPSSFGTTAMRSTSPVGIHSSAIGHRTMVVYKPTARSVSHNTPIVSAGLKLHTTSSATVHSVGGGGNGAGYSASGNGGGSNRSGVTPSYSFSVNSYSGLALASASSSIPLMARNVEGGMTADKTLARISPHRATIHDGDDDGYGDDDLHPSNPPADPYFTPVGDTPWWFIIALAAGYLCFIALRKKTRALTTFIN